jgi:hypothetical protein
MVLLLGEFSDLEMDRRRNRYGGEKIGKELDLRRSYVSIITCSRVIWEF